MICAEFVFFSKKINTKNKLGRRVFPKYSHSFPYYILNIKIVPPCAEEIYFNITFGTQWQSGK